eukprot:358824-Chlamydomonas_euryale.AAC.3
MALLNAATQGAQSREHRSMIEEWVGCAEAVWPKTQPSHVHANGIHLPHRMLQFPLMRVMFLAAWCCLVTRTSVGYEERMHRWTCSCRLRGAAPSLLILARVSCNDCQALCNLVWASASECGRTVLLTPLRTHVQKDLP